MRINRYISLATGLSRRRADDLVSQGQILVDGLPAEMGQQVRDNQKITHGQTQLYLPKLLTTILLNKPLGYVVSRNGQGNKTIYELLPSSCSELKPIGRLDKDSTGLLLLTNDGQLTQSLSHPSNSKQKVYDVWLDKPLSLSDFQAISETGVQLEDGTSRLKLSIVDTSQNHYHVSMSEGRNRQIRRTFVQLGYKVTKLHRTHFGPYVLGHLRPGEYKIV